MRTRMYTIRDIVAETYLVPLAYPNDATAKRHFEIMKEDSETILGKRPQDYELYFVGEYDMTTAAYEPCFPIIRIDTVKGGTDV